MKIKDWILESQELLKNSGIDSARLDCLILLEDETGKERGWLLAHPEYELSAEQISKLKKLLTRRTSHEPLAYIRGKSEFYGHTFMVNKHVLVPRPESEAMIGLLLEIYAELEQRIANSKSDSSVIKIADIGTGSGALGITAKLELPARLKLQIDLIDIDQEALKVAKTNVVALTTGISTLQSDLLDGTAADYDLLLCNLPYVPDEYAINQAAKHEPAIALFSGADGLNHYRKLLSQLKKRQNCPLYLLLESLEFQHAELSKIALEAGYKLQKTNGLIQLFKRI